VGNKLYFAGTEVTDLSGGGQNWSRFPALQDVAMSNFSLRQLSTLQYQDGATLVSLTGNNLLYNGQAITTGTSGNAANWSQFPAKTNITAGSSTITVGNIQNNGSNITNGNTFTNSLGVGGLSLVPIASITSGGDLSCRNIEVGDSVTGLADVNIYGATALPGDNALYVEGGVQFQGGLIHGFSAGVLPVAGINTGRIDMVQAGFNLLHPLVGAITTGTAMALQAGAAMSLAAGGALSLAAGSYVEINTDEVDFINTTQGNQSTTIRVANIQMPLSVAATTPLQINNTAGGGINLVGTGGVGQIAGFSTIAGDKILSPFISTNNINLSTINGDVYQPGSITTTPSFSTVTTSSIIAVGGQNIVLEDYLEFRVVGGAYPGIIEGLNYINFQASNTVPSLTIEASTLNFFAANALFSGSISTPQIQTSSIFAQTSLVSPLLSTGNLNVSTINGLSLIPTDTPTFDTVTTSSIIAVAGQNVVFEDYIEFRVVGGLYPGVIENLNYINFAASNTIPLLTLEASSLAIVGATTIFTGSISTTEVQASTLAAQHVSTTGLSSQTSFLSTMASDFIDAQGLFVTRTQVPTGGGVEFQFNNDPTDFSRFQVSEVASNTMVCLLNNDGTPPGIPGSNLKPLGVAELWITGATFNYGAARLYAQPDYGNFGLDMIDANGVTIIEAMAVFGGPAGYTTILGSVSSITGFNDVGGSGNATGFDNIVTAPTISTQNLLCSTINGLPPGVGGGGSTISTFAVLEGAQFFTSSIQGLPVVSYLNTNSFSTLITSSFATSSIAFSTARYFGSNTGFYYPIILDQDHAQPSTSTAADGVGLQIVGHNFQTGAIRNTMEMGVRGNGEGYILSYWPGSDLEDLYIDATDTIFRNSAGVSTIINQGSAYAVRSATGAVVVPTVSTLTLTTSSIVANTGVFQTLSTQSLLVSSIIGNDARPAYTNNFQTSTMVLTASVPELGYWNSASPTSNVNTSGYDCIVGVNGTYKMGCRIQGFNGSGGGGGSEEILLNFLKNSSTITNVQTTQELANNSEESIYQECLVQCANGDNLQVEYFSSDNNIQVFATATSPAAILTVYKID
jgi:hypothetical protein